MQWLQDALPAIFGPSLDASKNLQTSEMLDPDQLRQFFEASAEMFSLPEVKVRLRNAHAMGQDANSVIEEMQRTIFERQGVAGSWGIQCLGRVNAHYKTNVELLSEFYSFISKEEEAVDEAELPPADFHRKMQLKQSVQAQQRIQEQQMELLSPAERDSIQSKQRQQVSVLEEKLKSLPEQERMAYLQQHLMPVQAATQQSAHSGSAMSQAEQLRFFQSLHTSGGGSSRAGNG